MYDLIDRLQAMLDEGEPVYVDIEPYVTVAWLAIVAAWIYWEFRR